jgi:hypothetical protein
MAKKDKGATAAADETGETGATFGAMTSDALADDAATTADDVSVVEVQPTSPANEGNADQALSPPPQPDESGTAEQPQPSPPALRGPQESVRVVVMVENLGLFHEGDVTDDPEIVALLDDGTGRVVRAGALEPTPPVPLEGVIEGRIVHYVLPGGPNAGESRPAVIVKVWDKDSGCVNLIVFPDGSNDGPDFSSWVTSVLYSEAHEARTWHWIPRA